MDDTTVLMEPIPNVEEQDTELLRAIRDGDIEKVKTLLDNRGEDAMYYKAAPSALMVAVETDHYDIGARIIQHISIKMKNASKNNDNEALKSAIGHFIAEIKYKADEIRVDINQYRLWGLLDLVIDIIAGILEKIHADKEQTVEDALIEAAGNSSKYNEWPLLIASGCGFVGCVQILLQQGHKIHAFTDLLNNNCLERAINGGYRGVVKAILKMDINETIFKLMEKTKNYRTGYFGASYESPLRLLIKHMPDMAKLFLDLCVIKAPYETTYEYKFIDDFSWVLEERGYPTDESDVDGEGLPPTTCSKVMRNLRAKRQKPSNHVLSCMIQYGKLELLKHPLVSRWIKQKWKIAKRIHICFCILYCTFLSFLTSYAMVSPIPALNPLCGGGNGTGWNGTMDCMVNGNYLLIGGIITIILAGLHIAIEFLQIYQRAINYFRDWENYLQLFVFTGSIAFVSTIGRPCQCVEAQKWQLGAFVIFCAWFNLIVLLKNTPVLGAPINLLFNICYNYLKLVYLPILLVISFGLPFYMLFVNNDNGMKSTNGFVNAGWSLLRTLVGTTGDTGFSDVFLGSPLPYLPVAAIMFIIFLILMPVLFNNMLVGLAVGDASDALQEADLKNVACQVEYIILTEDAFPCLKRKLVDKDTEDPAKDGKTKIFDVRHLYKNFFKDNDQEEDEEDALGREDLLSFEDDVMEELEELRSEMQEHDEVLKNEMLKRDQEIKNQLKNLHALLESIQQKLN